MTRRRQAVTKFLKEKTATEIYDDWSIALGEKKVLPTQQLKTLLIMSRHDISELNIKSNQEATCGHCA
jgi:hypothetical protein